MKKIFSFRLCAWFSVSVCWLAAMKKRPTQTIRILPMWQRKALDTTELTEDTQPSESEETAASTNSNMDAFIASIQGQIDQMAGSVESSGMGLDVVARGNSLVYIYQYNIDLGDTSLIKGSLESALDSNV